MHAVRSMWTEKYNNLCDSMALKCALRDKLNGIAVQEMKEDFLQNLRYSSQSRTFTF